MAVFRLTRSEFESKGILASTGSTHVVQLLRGRARRILVSAAHFHTDSSLFLPRGPGGGDSGVAEAREFSNDAFWNSLKRNNPDFVAGAKESVFVPPGGGDPAGVGSEAGGLETILAALKFLSDRPDQRLVVAGHTDRAGSEAHNLELSDARARCVAAMLIGDRSGFIKAAKEHARPESDGSMLRFAARARGFPCDPADRARPTAAEIKAFQKAYNEDFKQAIGVDGIVGDQTRGAYFDILDAELETEAGGAETLSSLRGRLKFVDDSRRILACGERFPAENPDVDGLESQANRRVEILFFPESIKPNLASGDPPLKIYGQGAFEFERLDPGFPGTSGEDGASGDLALEDAPPPEAGAGGMEDELVTDMDKLQDASDPQDQYAFLDPFDAGFPEFGNQAVGDFPISGGATALV